MSWMPAWPNMGAWSPGKVLGRGFFILSRSIGALAHAWEESNSGLRNKGPEHRTILPDYVGPAPREVP